MMCHPVVGRHCFLLMLNGHAVVNFVSGGLIVCINDNEIRVSRISGVIL